MRWLDTRMDISDSESSDRSFYITFGMIPRRLGKHDLELQPADLTAAHTARAGWDPSDWSVDVAARVLVLCGLSHEGQSFADRFMDLCRSADVGEAIALYSGLPLYPSPELLETQAAEGLRTNMRAQFEAIAHRNPYPRERFDDNRWNQMVLKALFIGSSLAPIQGLDERANPELANILCDYAHERWAAGRPVTPELWRCVGPFATGTMLADLQRVLTTGDTSERKAAALALSESSDPHATELMQQTGTIASAIDRGELTWKSLADEI